MSFKVGDRVRIREWDDMRKEFGEETYLTDCTIIPCTISFTDEMEYLCGRTATIESMTGDFIRLDFGNVKDNFWAFSADMLEPINETIVIYRKGKETIALDKSTGEKAVAKCHPEDKYDFLTGARVAFDRLVGNDNIKIGDTVEVIDSGGVFRTYEQWIGLKGYETNYLRGATPETKKTYKVLNIEKHGIQHRELCLIQDPSTTQVFIIGIEGVSKVKR